MQDVNWLWVVGKPFVVKDGSRRLRLLPIEQEPVRTIKHQSVQWFDNRLFSLLDLSEIGSA
jgi:hypothetical protein